MASGLPDYSRLVRPVHGGALTETIAKVAVANDTTFLIDVLGKGKIYGGVLLINYTSTQRLSSPTVFIDGVQMVSASFIQMNFYELNKPHTQLYYQLKYDDTNFAYAVALTPDITFESQVTIGYVEGHGTTPTIIAWMIYALL